MSENSKIVLVVEDNELNMKLVRGLMKIANHRLLEASDAESAIELARRHLPDLILMDVQLPGMDGLEATRIIRNDPDTAHIPVIALTSYAMQGDDTKAKAAGCCDYITKPIDTKKFLESINQYLRLEPASKPSCKVRHAEYSPRILVVDDEPLNVKLLTAKLASQNYETIKAYSGEQALEAVQRTAPDLILLDVMMPGIDGYEVTRRLKSSSETQKIPIILITALNGKEDKKKALELGADEFLNKPVNTEELRTRVASLIRLKEYQEQISTRTETKKRVIKGTGTIAGEPEQSQRPEVLLIEDEDADALLVERCLFDLDCRISRVRTGAEAFKILDMKKIDLILLDVMLPGLSGFEICRKLKENENTLPIQVVMMTPLNDMKSKIKGIELGADEYLIKPINREELLARVKSLLKKKSYLDQLQQRANKALEAAITDELTGIRNYAYLKHFLDLEIKRASRHRHSLSFMMVDVDDFKRFNDTHGHPAGDLALKTVAEIIRGSIREIDIAARYGGEEFAVVLPYSGRQSAETVARRLLKNISAHQIFTDFTTPPPRRLTVSMGISFYPADAKNMIDLIQAADIALYQAKQNGKNQLHMLTPETMQRAI